MENKKEFIENMFQHGLLISGDLLEKKVDSSVISRLEHEGDLLVLNTDYLDIVTQQKTLVDWYMIDGYRVAAEKDRDDELYQAQLQSFKEAGLKLPDSVSAERQQLRSTETDSCVSGSEEDSNFSFVSSVAETLPPELLVSSAGLAPPVFSPDSVQIIISYKNEPRKYEVKDFTSFFSSRHRFLENILRNHQELLSTLPINRILGKKEKESISIIGIIEEIGETKNGNLMLTIEDPTGRIKAVVSKNKKELHAKAKDLVLDEVVGIVGILGENIIFVEEVVWPDIPSVTPLKKGDKEEYAVFLSDVHVGSKLFLKEEFGRFLHWISGSLGSPAQRDMASKVKYIIIAGDVVDGVGIYPSQQEELEIKEIVAQYEEFCRLIRQIPADKQIVICPGNHDAVHLAEPQSSFDEKFSPALFSLPNVTLVTNPALVNIGKTETFSGFDVLLYHGYSFDYYVANVESIRNSGGYHRADLIMKFLLKRRHLSPSFRSTPYYPGHKEDPLLIKKIPDFFVSGHIHYSKVDNYRGITIVCGSCWQGTTAFQEKLGHQPEPARVPVVNLKTREVKILKFG